MLGSLRFLLLFCFSAALASPSNAAQEPGSWYQPYSSAELSKGETELMYAASFGDVERVREYLRRGDNVNQPDKDGWTALHYACLGGESAGWPKEMSRLEVMKLLVQAGANVNAREGLQHTGETPLAMAAVIGQVEWVKFLLAKGADPNIPGDTGPLIPATAWTGHTDEEAAEVITLLVKTGGDINAKDFIRHQTALQIAKEDKRAAVSRALKMLMRRG